MLAELFLYLDLLIFLAGTLLYGFLTREFLRRGRVLRRNWPLRFLLACWCIWYGGALIDEILAMLLGGPEHIGGLNTSLDLVRGFAWLFSFPLLAHTLAHELANLEESGARRRRILLAIAYLPLVFFVSRALRFAEQGEWLLVRAVADVYSWILAHAAISFILAAFFAVRLLGYSRDARLNRFLKLLMAVMTMIYGVLLAAAVVEPWGETVDPSRLVRTFLLAGLLLPGGLFAFFVQRYNLLRLSLSHGTLRHFLSVLLLVLLVMVAGPTVAREHPEVLRRFVAWGLIFASVVSIAYRPLVARALKRSVTLRRLLGHHVSPRELDHLMETIQQLDLGEKDALARTADELGVWLGARTRFLPQEGEAAQTFWQALREHPMSVIHQLDPPDFKIAAWLEREKLHAIFALRIEGQLTGVLALGTSRTGGGYADGEIEAIQLVMRQLAGNLALRRLLGHRLAEERRLAEHERLGMLGLVAASLAHELKNPLSSIKVLAQSLREELAEADPDSEGVTDLDLILEQIERLNLTAHEILGLARPRPGICTDLTDLVRSSLYILQAEARKRGVEIDSTIEELGTVPGTAAGWQTVIFNLVLNAIEHTPHGGEVQVRLLRESDGLLFETSNPGGPLSAEEVKRLFAPFVSEGGTGLGLTLVARRVEELVGTVEAAQVDGQVVFRVLAPLRENPCEPEDDHEKNETEEADTSVGPGDPP